MISMIAAVGKNNELGYKNDLIWHLPGDLKFFKETTLNHKVFMGYFTYLSLPFKLPNRDNFVFTDPQFGEANLKTGFIETNFEEVLEKYLDSEEEVFIIGGAYTYEYFLKYAKRIYLTKIDDSKNADVYFPKMDCSLYNETLLKTGSDNSINYKHYLYERKNEIK